MKQITQILPFIGALANKTAQDMQKQKDYNAVEPLFTTFYTTYADMDAEATKKDHVDRSLTAEEIDELT